MKSPLKWHGGKGPLATWIWSQAPPPGSYKHFGEVYCGSAAVLLHTERPDVSEFMNDLDGWLMNLWEVLEDDQMAQEFIRRASVIPFSQPRWDEAEANYSCGRKGSQVDNAIDYFVLVRQSCSGRKGEHAPLSKARTRRGMNDQVSAWLSCVDRLPDVHRRLRSVVLYSKPAVQVIEEQDSPTTLFYLDPPYLHETRTTTEEYGEYEMSRQQHIELLDLVNRVEGKVMLSAYHSDLYTEALRAPAWRFVEKDVANRASFGDVKQRRSEVLWMNYV